MEHTRTTRSDHCCVRPSPRTFFIKMIRLIINAEDFGLSKVFNDVILDLAEKGLITSCNVMADFVEEKKDEQVAHLRRMVKEKKISAGLHLFTEQEALDEQEIQRQWDVFIQKMGFSPQHIDIHKYFAIEECREVVAQFAAKKGVPSRNHEIHFSFVKMCKTPRYHATGKSIEEIKAWIDGLGEGTHEIIFHPGKYDSKCRSSLNKDREEDIRNIKALNNYLLNRPITKSSYTELV